MADPFANVRDATSEARYLVHDFFVIADLEGSLLAAAVIRPRPPDTHASNSDPKFCGYLTR